MLELKARIIKDGKVVGYTISDGRVEINFSILHTWAFAKRGQIRNVKALGDEYNPKLSGENDFKIRSLPKVNITDILNTKSRNIVIEQLLHDSELSKRTKRLGHTIIGYKIRNIGNEGIQYKRVIACPDYEYCIKILQPNESIYISNTELALLARDIGNNFANGELVLNNQNCFGSNVTYEKLSIMYKFKKYNNTNGMGRYVSNNVVKQYDTRLDTIDIRQILDKEIIAKYFMPKHLAEYILTLEEKPLTADEILGLTPSQLDEYAEKRRKIREYKEREENQTWLI